MNAFLFVAISLVSGFGGTAMALVAGVWILDLTGSVSQAGLAGLCVYAPTLLAPWLGGLVDRWPRRTLVITVDVLLAAALVTLFAVRSRDQVWLIFAVLVAYGIGYVLLDAGESALLPAALPESALGRVNGWRSSAQEGMKLIAPLTGAALYAWQGGGAVAAMSATMPLLAAAMYALLRLDVPGPAPASGPPPTMVLSSPASGPAPAAAPSRSSGSPSPVAASPAPAGAGLRAGLAVLWGRRATRDPVLIAGVAIGLSGFTTAAVYARVTEGLGLSSTFLGVLASAQGAGSILAGLVVGGVMARRGTTSAAVAGAVAFALGCLLWCLPWWPSMIAGSVAAGVGLPCTLVAAVTAVQTGTPSHLLGRVAATSNTVMFGPIALTNPLGAAAVHLGDRLPLTIAAAVALIAAASITRRRVLAQPT